MKTPTARKLPSGSWFVRVRINGEDIGITRDTEKAAIAEAMAIKAGIKREEVERQENRTLREAINDYIDERSAVLSPSTVRGYRIVQNHRFASVMDIPLRRIKDADFQRAVNTDSRSFSAKTLRNSWGLVSSVLSSQCGRNIRVTLPQVIREERPFLQPEQIPIFQDAIRGTKHELSLLLGLHGLRASEILAVQRKDIDLQKGTVSVHGAAVLDENNTLVQKVENKNSASRRTIPILIPRLAELVQTSQTGAEDRLSHASSSAILHHAVTRACEKTGLPPIGVHGLRHSFASLCYHLGLSEATTMRLGGWSDPGTMRKIYTHLADSDLSAQSQKLADFFLSQKNGNENGNE